MGRPNLGTLQCHATRWHPLGPQISPCSQQRERHGGLPSLQTTSTHLQLVASSTCPGGQETHWPPHSWPCLQTHLPASQTWSDGQQTSPHGNLLSLQMHPLVVQNWSGLQQKGPHG